MKFKDLDTRICISVYRWRTQVETGIFTAELTNNKGTIPLSIISCPEVYGPGKFRVLTGEKCSTQAVPLETAIQYAEQLMGITHVNLVASP